VHLTISAAIWVPQQCHSCTFEFKHLRRLPSCYCAHAQGATSRASRGSSCRRMAWKSARGAGWSTMSARCAGRCSLRQVDGPIILTAMHMLKFNAAAIPELQSPWYTVRHMSTAAVTESSIGDAASMECTSAMTNTWLGVLIRRRQIPGRHTTDCGCRRAGRQLEGVRPH
jgi:hypothetical protein